MQDHLEQVMALAQLARIDLCEGLPPKEAEKKLRRFAGQFKDILALMDTLAEVDTREIEPLYWPLSAQASPLREDIAEKTCSRADILDNAPDQEGGFFVVPRIV